MTKERELLKRAVDMLGFWLEEHEHRSVKEFMEEIRAHLATEEDSTIEVPRDIWIHLKKGRVTLTDIIEAINKAEEGKQEEGPAHQPWCTSLTQMLMSNPPQRAPCNCRNSKAKEGKQEEKPVAWMHLDEDFEYRIKPKTVKKEGWVNIYKSWDDAAYVSDAFDSELEADLRKIVGRVACIRIEWEEEE